MTDVLALHSHIHESAVCIGFALQASASGSKQQARSDAWPDSIKHGCSRPVTRIQACAAVSLGLTTLILHHSTAC